MTDVGRQPRAARTRELNNTIRYTMWSVFSLGDRHAAGASVDADTDTQVEEVLRLLDRLDTEDVRVRGLYDVAGFRADADLLVWTHAETAEQLQDAYHRFRRTEFGRRLRPVWSQMALHRPAEFNSSHIPAYLADDDPGDYVCVYPFIRSYEWYLLPDGERRSMLAEHGKLARDYPDVRANTVASFALGDYEWMLAFEANELHRIVDLMRHLRGSAARRHVREEVPFFTGRRRDAAALIRGIAR